MHRKTSIAMARDARFRLIAAALLAVGAIAGAGWRIAAVRRHRTAVQPPRTPVELIVALERTAAADPRPREAQEALGAACLKLDHFLSARAAFRGAESLGSDSLWLRQQLAWCALRLDYRDEALREYRRLLRRDPHRSDGYLRLAAAALRMGDPATAGAALHAMPDAARHALMAAATPESRLQVERFLMLLDEAASPGEALRWARHAILRLPAEPAGYFVAGNASLKLGCPRDALLALDTGLRMAPGRADMHALRGDALLALGGTEQRSQARAAYTRAVVLQRTLGPAHYRLGQLALAAGSWEEAGRAFQAAHSLGTEPLASLRGVAQAAEGAGQSLAATAHWAEYWEEAGNTTTARRLYRHLLDYPDTALSATLRLADLDARESHLREAIQRLEAAVPLDRGLVGSEGPFIARKRERAKARRDEGTTHSGEPAAHSTLYSPLSRFRPFALSRQKGPGKTTLEAGAVAIWRALARAYRGNGRNPEAIAAWRRVAELDPASAPDAFQELAAIAESLADFDAAERYYEEALRRRPEDAACCRRYGSVLWQRRRLGDRLARATAQIERAVALAPDDSAGFLALGRVYEAGGREAEALIALRHAIDLAPGAGASYLALGRLARRVGRPDESREMLAMYRLYRQAEQQIEGLKAALSARPRDAGVRLALADYYFAARDFSHAAPEYERSLTLDTPPLSSEARRAARRHLALAYRHLARREDAAAQLALAGGSSTAP
jgi:tetratricopeptide (TPR) repeat protein